MNNESGKWSVLKGNDNGKVVLIRIRTDIESASSFPTRIIVNMDWVNPETQAEIEDQLSGLLESDKTLFVLSLTRDENKQFVYYTAVPQEVEGVLESYAKTHPEFGITYALDQDPEWKFYTLYSVK